MQPVSQLPLESLVYRLDHSMRSLQCLLSEDFKTELYKSFQMIEYFIQFRITLATKALEIYD